MFKKLSTTFLLVACYSISVHAVPQLVPGNILGGLGGTNPGGLVGGVTNPGGLVGGLGNTGGLTGGLTGAATGALTGAVGGGLVGGVVGTTEGLVAEAGQLANNVHVLGH